MTSKGCSFMPALSKCASLSARPSPYLRRVAVHYCLARRWWIATQFLRGPPLQIRSHPLYRVFTEACQSWNGTRIIR